MDSTYDFSAERKKREAEVIRAALELCHYTGTAAFVLPVPGTSPKVYVTCGDLSGLEHLIAAKPDKEPEPPHGGK